MYYEYRIWYFVFVYILRHVIGVALDVAARTDTEYGLLFVNFRLRRRLKELKEH